MSEKLWNKISEHNRPYYIKKDDFCIYAREYIREGYQAGQTNSLILNFKKHPSKKGTEEWQYRTKAIKAFKQDIEQLLDPNTKYIITGTPSSKAKNDPKYDRRFEDLFKELKKSRPKIVVECPIEIKKTIETSRKSKIRKPDLLKENYIWKGFNIENPKTLCIFDDVLVSGAHFRAMSDFLRKNNYIGKIFGIFWARTIR